MNEKQMACLAAMTVVYGIAFGQEPPDPLPSSGRDGPDPTPRATSAPTAASGYSSLLGAWRG